MEPIQMKQPRGKLISTRWTPTTTKAVCYTCKHHDWDSMVMASMVRVQTFEHLTVNTYYCEHHAANAMQVEAFDTVA